MSFLSERGKLRIYAVSILIPVLLGGLTGWIISGSMDYDMLNKPAFSPPAWLFPVVWTVLYILMGVSSGMLKVKGLFEDGISKLYYLQLFVNLLWPIAFFVLKWRLFSFIWIILLAVLVIAMAVKFYRKDKLSGLLQIPYAVWTVFASYLTLFAYLLN